MSPRELASRMAVAAVEFVGAGKAQELAAGAVVRMQGGEEATQACVGALKHRIENGWISCNDVAGCAVAMALVAHLEAARTEEPPAGLMERVLKAVRS